MLRLCTVLLFSALSATGCTCATLIQADDAGTDAGSGMDASADAGDAGVDAERPPFDAGPLDPDAACASQSATAAVERLPVDIIWMVDNSVSMQPAIEQVQAGLDDFAALVGDRGLDYRVIMLSLRGQGTTSIGGSTRYQVCIPPPLSGDMNCGDGPNFFQVEMDVRSTQQVEQILGTLAQTDGYAQGQARGSAPWLDLLRPEATKTFVVVTDDNSRTCALNGGTSCQRGDPVITATSLEDFPGGPNPFNSLTLGPGILTPTYGTLFEGYTFSALYGWGSETDPDVTCTYPGGGSPPSPGQTYTTLVQRTNGARAQICDGAAAWGPFFEAVATAVERGSRIDCAITIPPPPDGSFFQQDRINVWVDTGSGPNRVGNTTDASGCGAAGGWYYDSLTAPTQVILCPATCDQLQAADGTTRSVEVQFGCSTIPI